jgi:hypothetical protein
MATLKEKIAAEQHARAMLDDHGLPQPDLVEYGDTCVRLLWKEEKLVMVVDIDEPPEGFEAIGEYPGDPGEEAA